MIKWIIISALFGASVYIIKDDHIQKCIRVEKVSKDTLWDQNNDYYINKSNREIPVGENVIVKLKGNEIKE